MSLFTDLREVFTAYAQRIKGLAAADEEIKADLDALSNQIGVFTWAAGQYIPTNVDPVDVSNIQANTTWKYMLIEATPGEQYTLAHVSSGNTVRAWCITDASGNVLDVADSMTDYAEQVITIPELGAYLIVHAYASTENANVTGATIKTRVDKLEADLDNIDESLGDVRADLEKLQPLTEDIKVALLNVASHIGLWSDGDGKKYYGALEAALYPYTGLVRISAVFTQGSAVISPFTPLNTLKAYLVVTGYYDDGTSKIITDYALSGTLEVGTSTITVSKENKTDTFDVVVSSSYWDYEWYASSGIAPLDINGNPAYGLFADGLFKLDKSHPEFAYAESLPVEVAIEFASIAKNNNIQFPMFSFCYNYDSDGGDGFKIFNNNDGKVQTSVSGSSIATETDFHVGSELQSIHAIVASTGCSFEFGDISRSGTGVFNNQWLLSNNIAYPRDSGGDIRLKSIKFKYLT